MKTQRGENFISLALTLEGSTHNGETIESIKID